MKKYVTNIEKSIENILFFEKENSIDLIIKTVFESILKAERSEFLKQETSIKNKANGYYSKLVKTINKYFRISIPRDRLGFFKPVFLECIKQQDQQLMDLSLDLYAKGLTTRDITKILNEFYGKKVSPSWISNITKNVQKEREIWQKKKLNKKYYFVYIDALNIAVRRDSVEKEAFYVVIGLKEDLKREVLGLYNIPLETSEGWRYVFKDLKERGFQKSLMIIADGLSNLSRVVKEEFPNIKFQNCITHKKRNINLKLRSKDKALVEADLKEVFKIGKESYTKDLAKQNLDKFIKKWRVVYKNIENHFQENKRDYLFNYLDFPPEIQSMIYTTNWIERLNKTIRRTTKIRNSFPNVDSALNLIYLKLIMEEEDNYRKYPITAFSNIKDTLDAMF